LRIIAVPVSFETLAVAAFAAVAHYAGTDADVLEGLASALDKVIEEAGSQSPSKLSALRLSIRDRIRSGEHQLGAPGPGCKADNQ
jgi:ElaB/YqjD/DUF883 family membrane-anchored ribosome-binding protein